MPEYKIETSDGLECMVAFSKLESILLKLGREGNFNEIKKIYKLNAKIPDTTGVNILKAALSTRQDSALEELLKFIPNIDDAASASLMGEVKLVYDVRRNAYDAQADHNEKSHQHCRLFCADHQD